MANSTPALGYQNKFSTTLNGGISATDTTIALVSLPTPTEGYLIIEPDSSTAWEVIWYTSKTGSQVVVPSVAAGRGVGGSTAASHSSGATVRMDSAAEMWTSLQDATGLTGLHRYGTDGTWFDYVASGMVWTADSVGVNLNASMTSGVIYINGRRHTAATITAHAFTLNKDTYIDFLYSTVDNVATPVYTEQTTNGASPALASNSVRVCIIQAAATITATTKVNQGQEDKVFPIASSIPYAVTDSLGNLICPRDPNRKVLGWRQLNTSNFTGANNSSVQDVTGLSMPIIVPVNRKIKLSAFGNIFNAANTNGVRLQINEGATILTYGQSIPAGINQPNGAAPSLITSPSSGLHTYKATVLVGSSGQPGVEIASGEIVFIMAELV